MGKHAIVVVFVVPAPTRLAAADAVREELAANTPLYHFLPNDDDKSGHHLRWHPGPAPDFAEDDNVLITMEGVTDQEVEGD